MKPSNRQEWRVLLDLLRMIRTATNEERADMLKCLEQARQKEGGMTFWVIEKVHERTGSTLLEPKYWAAGTNDPLRSSTWTSNIFAAIRFARREDADNVLHRMMVGIPAKSIEHIIEEHP